MDARSVLFALLRSAVSGEEADGRVKQACTPQMLDAVYALAAMHDLAHLVCHALERLSLPDCPAMERFRAAKNQAIFRYMRLEHDCAAACACLEAGGIPFIPLKGAVLRELYPEGWMRTSCDIDLLVREQELDSAVALLTDRGWKVQGKKNYHDISLFSPGGVHLELHFNIRENMPTIDRVLDRVWDHSAPVAAGRMEHRQSGAYLRYHLLAHMSYHFLGGGCGIRSVLDIWLLHQRPHDEAALDELCRAGGLEKFRAAVEELAAVWFGGCAHTPLTRKMEDLILRGGVYGGMEGGAAFKQARSGGKWKHLWQRVFMPYDHLIIKYPLLKRHKWLTPVFQVVRWFSVLGGGKWKRALRELRINRRKNQADLTEAKRFMEELGLCPEAMRNE